jgi:hypothetical protein
MCLALQKGGLLPPSAFGLTPRGYLGTENEGGRS